MTLKNISAAQYVSGKLRQNLTDFNATDRTANYSSWIYPHKPQLADMIDDKDNFPRISVEDAGNFSSHRLGQQSTDYQDTITLRITAWSVRDLICDVETTAGEAHTFITGTDEYTLTALPVSSIEAVSGTVAATPHTFVSGTDYTLIDADGDGMWDTIDWSPAGTNPDNGTDFAVDYVRRASGSELARMMIQAAHEYLRKNWLGWTEHSFFNYRKIASAPNAIDTQIGVFSHELTIQFNGINAGESV